MWLIGTVIVIVLLVQECGRLKSALALPSRESVPSLPQIRREEQTVLSALGKLPPSKPFETKHLTAAAGLHPEDMLRRLESLERRTWFTACMTTMDGIGRSRQREGITCLRTGSCQRRNDGRALRRVYPCGSTVAVGRVVACTACGNKTRRTLPFKTSPSAVANTFSRLGTDDMTKGESWNTVPQL